MHNLVHVFLIVPALLAGTVMQPTPATPPPSPLPPSPVAPGVVVVPTRFEARAGENLDLALESATGSPLAWTGRPVNWFFVRVAGSQENRDVAPGVRNVARGAAGEVANTDVAAIPLGQAGITMIGVDFAPVNLSLSAKELDALLAGAVTKDERDRVMKDLPAGGSGRLVKVRSIACAKSLVRVLTPEGERPAFDAQTPGSKSGQFNEIRGLVDPLESVIGGDITVRFHAEFDKAARARGVATNLDTGKAREFISDASGIGLFHLDEPGRWRVTFTTARRIADDPDVDIVLYSASLTFAATRTEVAK